MDNNELDWVLQNEEPKKVEEQPTSNRRKTECKVRINKDIYRRAYSETQLLDAVGYNFKDGECYNCITGGDVDGMSYLRVVLRQQDIDHVLVSTWVMASDDILAIEEYLEAGRIKKLDLYLGEIFPSSYVYEYMKLKEIFKKYKCGRLVVFKNHSKIFAGTGPKFDFGIQTSANINYNPRTENGSITIGTDIYQFYKEYFDGIRSIVKEDV